MLCGRVSAQEVDFDYRAYKFYKDEEPLLVSLEDTMRLVLPKAGYVADVARRSEYALRVLNYRSMGERDVVAYMLGNQHIDYTTARLLSQLRVYNELDRGNISRGLYSTKVLDRKSVV